MAKNKQRKKRSTKALTTGDNAQTAASQAGQGGSTAQVTLSPTDGKAHGSAWKTVGKATALPRLSRRNVLRAAVASVMLVGVGTAIHRHDVQARELHDLSAIGGGAPSVVQIHDPSCPLCRRLMGATRKAIEDFPAITYRVADVTTNEGHTFQEKYNVPNVTLLLFDADGRHIETLNGVRTADELRQRFAETFDTSTSAIREAKAVS